jgi:hypothetical protein
VHENDPHHDLLGVHDFLATIDSACNLGSWIARLGIPISSLYSSTKGAIETLTRAWPAEFGPAGVRVNAISPGVILTPDPDATSADEHPAEVMMRGTPAGASGTPDAIAHAAVYLASDEAVFVHGTVIDVDHVIAEAVSWRGDHKPHSCDIAAISSHAAGRGLLPSRSGNARRDRLHGAVGQLQMEGVQAWLS